VYADDGHRASTTLNGTEMMAEYLENLPSSVPEPHRQFLERIEQLETDNRIVGVAIGGSLLTNSMDEFSDLDLLIVVEPTEYARV
jgi:predicted nucleotidyltransferase